MRVQQTRVAQAGIFDRRFISRQTDNLAGCEVDIDLRQLVTAPSAGVARGRSLVGAGGSALSHTNARSGSPCTEAGTVTHIIKRHTALQCTHECTHASPHTQSAAKRAPFPASGPPGQRLLRRPTFPGYPPQPAWRNSLRKDRKDGGGGGVWVGTAAHVIEAGARGEARDGGQIPDQRVQEASTYRRPHLPAPETPPPGLSAARRVGRPSHTSQASERGKRARERVAGNSAPR